ncbi:hypothetical protein TWF696_003493 [Orbilia brochopaga]|uniref:Uncharacterized protein n=1 Tax=Orbilia brochopaga TaxID=3140254 RepID=A0AAV9TZN4_9PEZI
MADRPPKEEVVVTEEFDYEQYAIVPRIEGPVGGFEAFFERVELEELVHKREERIEKAKNVMLCKGCTVA